MKEISIDKLREEEILTFIGNDEQLSYMYLYDSLFKKSITESIIAGHSVLEMLTYALKYMYANKESTQKAFETYIHREVKPILVKCEQFLECPYKKNKEE